jgi:hypothetical protein
LGDAKGTASDPKQQLQKKYAAKLKELHAEFEVARKRRKGKLPTEATK